MLIRPLANGGHGLASVVPIRMVIWEAAAGGGMS
jgi:hypothetical protein